MSKQQLVEMMASKAGLTKADAARALDAFMESEISFNMPTKILCKPDCKGICKVCGKNLNEGDCGCDQFVPDPRMAAIKDIYDAFNKEV